MSTSGVWSWKLQADHLLFWLEELFTVVFASHRLISSRKFHVFNHWLSAGTCGNLLTTRFTKETAASHASGLPGERKERRCRAHMQHWEPQQPSPLEPAVHLSRCDNTLYVGQTLSSLAITNYPWAHLSSSGQPANLCLSSVLCNLAVGHGQGRRSE